MSSSTHIVVDLGFGDAGKGTMVDAIARRCSSPPFVVRHNGGAQAGHNVVTPDGRQHVFSQFGAATFVPGARTLLSKHFLLHPIGLVAEHEHLVSLGVTDALDRLFVDERALVITPFHQAMNRLREAARGPARHGTCGLGIGETVSDSLLAEGEPIRASDLRDSSRLREKLVCVRNRKLRAVEALLPKLSPANPDLALLRNPAAVEVTAQAFEDVGECLTYVTDEGAHGIIKLSRHLIFEGAQGVLLDEWHGFHPHTTWSTTTALNAENMIAEAGRTGPVTRLGVVRAYATRHGQGPFPSESLALTSILRDAHNGDDGWQGHFRCGWFDVPLTRYALACSPTIDALAVTCLDRLAEVPTWYVCDEHEGTPQLRPSPSSWPARSRLQHQEGLTRSLAKLMPRFVRVPNDPEGYLRALRERLQIPIAVASFGPTAEDKRWL